MQLVEKGQGLKKGEKIKRICLVRIVSTRPERLFRLTCADVCREGFPNMTLTEFINMFCEHNKCQRDEVVNRIEWEYL